jgi:hypothetical protein
MTDHFGATDRVADTLTALRADTDRMALPDSGSVRRRGEQRTRNQVVGSTLAVAALVAGALGVAGSLTGSDQSVQGPPGQGTATAKVTESEAPPVALAAQPLLDAADIPTFAGATGWQVSPDEAAADQPFLQCLASPSELGAPQTEKRFFYTELAPTASQHVLRFADVAAAEAAVTALRTDLDGCSEQVAGDSSVEERPTQAVGDLGFQFSRSTAPAGSEVSYVEVDVARQANVVVVLQWNGAVDEVSSADDTWVWDEAALTEALDRAIG